MKPYATTKVTTRGPTKRKFTGTDNPRHLRAIAALLRRPISRQELDSVTGVGNSPELVEELRCLGLDAPCQSISFIASDDVPCCPDVFSFSDRDRRMINRWMAQRMPEKAKVQCHD